MADLVREGFRAGTVDFSNSAVRTVIGFLLEGRNGIYAAEEPIMFELRDDGVYVVEGSHRAIAVALWGEAEMEGVDFGRIELVRRTDDHS